jgi:hypothetical protein
MPGSALSLGPERTPSTPAMTREAATTSERPALALRVVSRGGGDGVLDVHQDLGVMEVHYRSPLL